MIKQKACGITCPRRSHHVLTQNHFICDEVKTGFPTHTLPQVTSKGHMTVWSQAPVMIMAKAFFHTLWVM